MSDLWSSDLAEVREYGRDLGVVGTDVAFDEGVVVLVIAERGRLLGHGGRHVGMGRPSVLFPWSLEACGRLGEVIPAGDASCPFGAGSPRGSRSLQSCARGGCGAGAFTGVCAFGGGIRPKAGGPQIGRPSGRGRVWENG